MNQRLQRLAAPVRNRQGVAFPVALLGILGVSVTITAVLLTASMEAALSSAHKDATRGLYVAQGGLEAYVAQAGMGLAPASNVQYLPPGAPAGEETLITVRQIGSVPVPNAPLNWPNDALFSVQAQPINGGRTVGTVARVISQLWTLTNNVDAAIVTGSDIDVKGSTLVSDGSDSQLCSPDSAADYALQVGEDDTVVVSGAAADTIGATGTLDASTESYISDMLGVTMNDLIANADIKLPRGTYTINSATTTANPNDAQATPYNWGCPVDMHIDLQTGATKCILDGDQNHYPIVAIDASNADGSWGSVTINLDHGQGILVVYNGNLRIQGNLVFKGLIIVEGSFDVFGTGSGGAKIEGSIIGLGKGPGGTENFVDQDVGGNPTIRYNRCAINTVMNVLNNQNNLVRVTPPTASWYEVVR